MVTTRHSNFRRLVNTVHDIYKVERLTLSETMQSEKHKGLWQNGPGTLAHGAQICFKYLPKLLFLLDYWGDCAVRRSLWTNEWVWHLLSLCSDVHSCSKQNERESNRERLSWVMTWYNCRRDIGIIMYLYVKYFVHFESWTMLELNFN